MSAAPIPLGSAGPAISADDELATLARNGIVRVPAFHYLVDGYRYSNMADAMAQVARGGAREPLTEAQVH